MVEALGEAAGKIRWFHTIDLGGGVVTAGQDKSKEKLKTIHLPDDLTGKTVLDIGAWDGFFSFEAERRGAKKVLATDSFSWGAGGWGSKDGFNLARKALKSKVLDLDIDVMDLSAKEVGTFDIVLFLGVLYHLRHPLLALEKVSSVTGKQLILETQADMLCTGRPAAAFYPKDELDGDPTNWWGLNEKAVEAMLKEVGFREVRLVYRSPLWWRIGRACKLMLKGRNPFVSVNQARLVYHAYK